MAEKGKGKIAKGKRKRRTYINKYIGERERENREKEKEQKR